MKIKTVNLQLTTHFNLKEFVIHNEQYFLDLPEANQKVIVSEALEQAKKLEAFRIAIGNKPLFILSGLRSPEYNKSVGGAPDSFHMFMKATDVTYQGVKDVWLHDFTPAQTLFSGVIYYPKQLFFHLDRGNRRFWSRDGGFSAI